MHLFPSCTTTSEVCGCYFHLIFRYFSLPQTCNADHFLLKSHFLPRNQKSLQTPTSQNLFDVSEFKGLTFSICQFKAFDFRVLTLKIYEATKHFNSLYSSIYAAKTFRCLLGVVASKKRKNIQLKFRGFICNLQIDQNKNFCYREYWFSNSLLIILKISCLSVSKSWVNCSL